MKLSRNLNICHTFRLNFNFGGAYHISANSCRDNYSFLEALVRQLFKGDNYSKEGTINLLALLSHY